MCLCQELVLTVGNCECDTIGVKTSVFTKGKNKFILENKHPVVLTVTFTTSFRSLLTKSLLMILAAESLHYWVIKFNYIAIYKCLDVCGLGLRCVCTLMETDCAVLAGF